MTWPSTPCGHATTNVVTHAMMAPPNRTETPTEVAEMTRIGTPTKVAETTNMIVDGIRGVVIVEATKITRITVEILPLAVG